MSLIGFARVSTVSQDLTDQLNKLAHYGCEKIFNSKHSAKAEANKQALNELIDYVRTGDTVVVTKIDRFGRSLSQVLSTIELLSAKGVNLIAIDQNIDTSHSDPMSKAMVQLLAMFAEMERNFIVSRTTEGKIASGNFGGRKPKLTPEDKQKIKVKLKRGVSKMELSKQYNVSRATILNIQNS
ncbi:recombinase family protein [Pseudoalteromonas sp. T1lg122]|uniref:recombinase family protein n=1 Tax=Pseudoalteromonas sp. T1lg122 TaxID=2077094 RepID=UPI000CF5E77E|nr:recombinase family protein [Pseudoalteromonas sp. T1lg122]